MKYALIENNIVKQTQVSPENGFIEVPDEVICGMIKNGDLYETPPPYIPTQQEIDAEKDRMSDIDNWGLQKAFALVVLDEINTLRVAAGLNPRTVNQLKTAIRSKL